MNEDKAKKAIPTFSSYQEEAEWWDNHDPLEYFDTTEVVKVDSPKKRKDDVIIIRLDAELKRRLEDDAGKKGIGASTQGRIILNEYYSRSRV